MNRDEFNLFCAAMTVTDQRLPRAFYVFPQVSLGEVLGSEDQDAYDAIKCKCVDLLLADRRGNPIAVLEYPRVAGTASTAMQESVTTSSGKR